jgi:hypothetical protein
MNSTTPTGLLEVGLDDFSFIEAEIRISVRVFRTGSSLPRPSTCGTHFVLAALLRLNNTDIADNLNTVIVAT